MIMAVVGRWSLRFAQGKLRAVVGLGDGTDLILAELHRANAQVYRRQDPHPFGFAQGRLSFAKNAKEGWGTLRWGTL